MARPITWQDVAAPNVGAALAASQAAGDSITNALAGLGGVAQGQSDRIKADATKQAVAGILQSNDPLAAAAAQPQDWRVDPLAVAQAAQQTDARLRANKASDASLEASKVSTASNQAQLDDLLSTRRAEAIAQESWADTLKHGSVQFNSKYDGLQGQDAVKAGAILQSRLRDYHNAANDDERLRLERARVGKDKSNQNYINWEAEKAHDPDWMLQDPATRERERLKAAKGFGADLQLLPNGRAISEGEAGRAGPTKQESNAAVPGTNITYNDVNSDLNRERIKIQREQASAGAAFDAAIGGRDLLSKNAFAGLPVQAIPDAISKQIKMDVDEVQSRLGKVQAKYPKLDAAQAADIVLATRDRWSTWFNNPASQPEATAIADKYQAFNDIGRENGLAREQNLVNAPFAGKLASLDRQQQKLGVQAQINGVIDDETAAIVRDHRNADAAEAAAKAKRDKEVAAAAQKKAEDEAKAAKAAADALQRAFERH